MASTHHRKKSGTRRLAEGLRRRLESFDDRLAINEEEYWAILDEIDWQRSVGQEYKPAKVSEYFPDRPLRKGEVAVLSIRVSNASQARVKLGKEQSNLVDQIDDAFEKLEEQFRRAGDELDIDRNVKMVAGVEKAYVDAERPLLMKAKRICLKNPNPNHILVCPARTRLLRHNRKEDKRKGVKEIPTEEDCRAMQRLLRGVEVSWQLHPDSKEERSRETKRGMAAKGATPGRPRKPRRRGAERFKELKENIVRKGFKAGKEDGEIAEIVRRKTGKANFGTEAVRSIRSELGLDKRKRSQLK